ncbi:Holliday junction branch migration DNA helicase RuvB, partial [Enterobacter hormaechei]
IEADRLVSAGTIQPDDVVVRALPPKLQVDYNRHPPDRFKKVILINAANQRRDPHQHHFYFSTPGFIKNTKKNTKHITTQSHIHLVCPNKLEKSGGGGGGG